MVAASELRVLIFEDEYLLASDLSDQVEQLGAQVAGLHPRLPDPVTSGGAASDTANAAVIDIKLFDQTAFALARQLRQRGYALAFCSGYTRRDLPDDLIGLPFFTKPANAGDIVSALCRQLP